MTDKIACLTRQVRNYFWVTIWYKHYDEEFAISVRKFCFLKQIIFYPRNLKFQGIKHHCHKRNLFCETKFLLESVPYFFYCFFLFLSYFFFFLALCMSQKSPYLVTHYTKWVNTSWTYNIPYIYHQPVDYIGALTDKSSFFGIFGLQQNRW